MTERGVFAVDRGIWDHPMFAAEPFTEREAWLWLVGAAAWKPTRIRTSRGMTVIERGQLIHSERFLANRWKWSKSRVHRYLLLLKIEAMADHQTDHETNRITICNYEKYAFDGTTKRTTDTSEIGPPADRERTKEEELKEKKEDKTAEAAGLAFSGCIIRLSKKHFASWVEAYPNIDLRGELTARDAWLASDRATDSDRKNWFISTSKYLANRNQAAKTQLALQRPAERPPGSIAEII